MIKLKSLMEGLVKIPDKLVHELGNEIRIRLLEYYFIMLTLKFRRTPKVQEWLQSVFKKIDPIFKSRRTRRNKIRIEVPVKWFDKKYVERFNKQYQIHNPGGKLLNIIINVSLTKKIPEKVVGRYIGRKSKEYQYYIEIALPNLDPSMDTGLEMPDDNNTILWYSLGYDKWAKFRYFSSWEDLGKSFQSEFSIMFESYINNILITLKHELTHMIELGFLELPLSKSVDRNQIKKAILKLKKWDLYVLTDIEYKTFLSDVVNTIKLNFNTGLDKKDFSKMMSGQYPSISISSEFITVLEYLKTLYSARTVSKDRERKWKQTVADVYKELNRDGIIK